MPIRQVEEILHAERGLKFASEQRRVFRAEPERYDGRGVAKHCVSDLRFKLMEVLVRQHKPQAVFAQLRHHVRERQGRERLELVHVKEERAAAVGGAVGTGERGSQYLDKSKLELDQLRYAFTPFDLCQVVRNLVGTFSRPRSSAGSP